MQGRKLEDHSANISIHAAHEGCDISVLLLTSEPWQFQSTLPMRAATSPSQYIGVVNKKFQSTLPMRAATITGTYSIYKDGISIYAAHEGCDKQAEVLAATTKISIHAAHEGCDILRYRQKAHAGFFQSTQPMRAATHLAAA